MKKTLISLSVAAAVASVSIQANAQDLAKPVGQGVVKAAEYTMLGLGGLTGLSVLSNLSGSAPGKPIQGPGPTPTPTPTPTPSCTGDDDLVDGVCIGTTITVTVSGTGTVAVPVTFTYSPSV